MELSLEVSLKSEGCRITYDLLMCDLPHTLFQKIGPLERIRKYTYLENDLSLKIILKLETTLGSGANVHVGKLPPKLLSSSPRSPPFLVVPHDRKQHFYILSKTC